MEIKTQQINREDLLELTRRMTVKRNCFSRIAGAYIDEDGYVDGTFNRHFWNLKESEQEDNLELAKHVLFGETNVAVKEYLLTEENQRPGSFYQMLMALKDTTLKNDALLDVLYEFMAEEWESTRSYAIYYYYGSYDIPAKASDGEVLEDSQEVYQFLVCAICPIHDDYEPEKPVAGFLFPAFSERSGNLDGIDVFAVNDDYRENLLNIIMG